MTSDYDKAVESLRKDVKDLRADMKDVLSAIHEKTRDYVGQARESLHEAVAERAEQVREVASAVGHSCQDATKDCAVKIQEHPFASVLTAVGVGLVFGRLLGRKRS